MAATQKRYEFQPFCYEHHVEMKPIQTLAVAEEVLEGTFACPEPGCSLHYNRSAGYFMVTQGSEDSGIRASNGDHVARVRCDMDGAPMYLSEFVPQRRSLRLWKCPQCNVVRSNRNS